MPATSPPRPARRASSAPQPISLGLVTSVDTLVGGSDSITTGAGNDIMIGGIDADTIVAGDGNNIVFGDNGLIDWAASERGGNLAGDDHPPPTSTGSGRSTRSTAATTRSRPARATTSSSAARTASWWSTSQIAGSGLPEIVTTVALDGDTINAGNGHNIVFGDSGEISAAAANAPQFSSQPIRSAC